MPLTERQQKMLETVKSSGGEVNHHFPHGKKGENGYNEGDYRVLQTLVAKGLLTHHMDDALCPNGPVHVYELV
jgi:hypothetical protein